MGNRDLIAIGTSAGGVEALMQLARNLRPELPAAVLVTLHIAPQFKSEFDALLSRNGPLPAQFARDGEPYKKGRIYLAPPDRHLLVDGDRLQLGLGPRENNTRPAIDPMLRSAAVCCGARCIGVVLTGTLGDGAAGLWAVDECGGISVVQDPRDAQFADMPLNALTRVQADHVVALADLPALLTRLAEEPAAETVSCPPNIAFEVEIARGNNASMSEMDRLGNRSPLTCPDCQGVMWEIEHGDLIRYRCHVGHAYTAELMSLALDENLRRALASAVRGLEERVALAEKLQRDAEERQRPTLAATWRRRVTEYQQNVVVIRDAIRRMEEFRAHHGTDHNGHK